MCPRLRGTSRSRPCCADRPRLPRRSSAGSASPGEAPRVAADRRERRCIFKNPEEIPAGKLIDELGFKNFTIGKARVSEVHGNFIVNDGGATADEVLTLIEEIKAAAMRERGNRELHTEVQIVGKDS